MRHSLAVLGLWVSFFIPALHAQPPIYIGPVDVPTNEYGCSIIDTVNDYSYFGTTSVPVQIRKINMQASGALPTLVGSLTLNAGEGKCGGREV
jgi:hypothetical protein